MYLHLIRDELEMTTILSPYRKYLAANFKFSPSFISFVSTDQLPDLEPWWFFCKEKRYIDSWCTTVARLYRHRQLVPFANWLYTDDISCFDGADTSGNPKVFYVHAFASAGWEDRGSVADFDEWLKSAKKDSDSYKAERSSI